MKIQGEQIFGIPTNYFGISPSESGYTLEYSADGKNFTAWTQETPAGENAFVCHVPKGSSFRLSGNSGDVYIQY